MIDWQTISWTSIPWGTGVTGSTGMSGVVSEVVARPSVTLLSKRLCITTREWLFGGVLRPPHAINEFHSLLLDPFVDGSL